MCSWVALISILTRLIPINGNVQTLSSSSIIQQTTKYCHVVLHQHTDSHVMEELTRIYAKDNQIRIGLIDLKSDFSGSKSRLFGNKDEREIFGQSSIIIFERGTVNRKCLSQLPPAVPKPTRIHSTELSEIVESINSLCQTFRRLNGQLTIAGLHRASIENNLFNFGGLSMKDVQFDRRRERWAVTDDENNEALIAQCEVRSANTLSYDEFRHDYLERNRPVILTDAVNNWPAFQTWNRSFFRSQYESSQIHVKLGVNGVFEGPEQRSQWLDAESTKLPESILEQIEFPELVMARPGQVELNMNEIFDLFQNTTRDPKLDNWISAYIEYTRMSSHFEKLKKDAPQIDYFHELILKHQNIWIGDGQTLGKMHFDEYENALVMVKGSKQFIVYDPRNNYQLYEGHIPEARFSVTKSDTNLPYTLKRSGLQESTSLVMSPVDILNPNYERFPNFKSARPMNCTVGPGQMLFLPSYWWHEVQSYPDSTEPLNVAVNFWYEPFFQKEFPCQTCPLTVNPKYFSIL